MKYVTGVGKRVRTTLFNYLKRLDRDFVTRLINVVSENGSDATNYVMRMFQLVSAFITYNQMCKLNQVHCADHSVNLALLRF